jgi:hypothetical protein
MPVGCAPFGQIVWDKVLLKEIKMAAEKGAPAEKQTNCITCNKPIKKLKRYYRDGKFYCNKRCWIKAVNKNKEQANDKK